MSELEGICEKRKAAHAKLLSLKSKVYEGFLEMEKAAFSGASLAKKTKELSRLVF